MELIENAHAFYRDNGPLRVPPRSSHISLHFQPAVQGIHSLFSTCSVRGPGWSTFIGTTAETLAPNTLSRLLTFIGKYISLRGACGKMRDPGNELHMHISNPRRDYALEWRPKTPIFDLMAFLTRVT